MSKFKVRITRVETYYRDVEVEAESIEDALAKAEENEQDNEYCDLFDYPDDVQTSFKDARGKLYRLPDLLRNIDTWVEGISAMSEIDAIRKEAHEMAGMEEDESDCPAELEREYTLLADKYGFRFDEMGHIVQYDLTSLQTERPPPCKGNRKMV